VMTIQEHIAAAKAELAAKNEVAWRGRVIKLIERPPAGWQVLVDGKTHSGLLPRPTALVIAKGHIRAGRVA
jgi:hypothetical protein